jgi:hypothetical protein
MIALLYYQYNVKKSTERNDQIWLLYNLTAGHDCVIMLPISYKKVQKEMIKLDLCII